MFRRWAERVTRQSSFCRRLPSEFGKAPIYVSPGAGLRYLFRPMAQIDKPLFSLASRFVQPGDTVWDVGANVGLFSFSAAHRAGPSGQVIAFEPDAWLLQLLRRSASLQPQHSAPVQIVPAAVASACDLRHFNIARRSRATNFLSGYGSTQTGGVSERHTVVALSLDWLAPRLPRPDVVKIDVEGAELEVLQGALELLNDVRPLLLCEVCGERSAEVTALLRAYGYRLYDGESTVDAPCEVDAAPWSTIAIPPGRPAPARATAGAHTAPTACPA